MSSRPHSATARLSPELVALCERPEPRLGPEPFLQYFTEADYNAAAARLIAEAGAEPLWVFAYGSLLWRPEFEMIETCHARVEGWRRDFCLEIKRWRGSPNQPGLMMGLRKGGNCSGLVMRLDESARHAQLVRLLRREVDAAEDLRSVTWLDADLSTRKIKALAFWAEPTTSRMYVNKAVNEQADLLSRACGSTGSGAAYLYNTIVSLAQLGLKDEYLETLGGLVASKILDTQFTP